MTDSKLEAQLAEARIYIAELERTVDAWRRRALDLEAWHGSGAVPPSPQSTLDRDVAPHVEQRSEARQAETVRLVFDELRTLQTQYLEADAVIADLVRTAAERLTDIEAKEEAIAMLTSAADALRGQLEDRDGLIQSLTRAAEARLATAEALAADLRNAHAALEELRGQLEAKEEERSRLSDELGARQEVIDVLKQTCDDRLELATRAGREADEARQALDGLHEQLVEKEREIQRLAAELANRQELLERLAIPEAR